MTYMLYVLHTDGTTENVYDSDESKLWDLIDEMRHSIDNTVKSFDISEVKNAPAVQLTQEHKDYLVELRDSGITNMSGATPYLMDEFELSEIDANSILTQWIISFKK